MTNLISEENAAAATAATKKPKRNKKAHIAPRRAHIPPARPKSSRKATSAKKAPKGQTKAEVAKPKVARSGSKTAKILGISEETVKRHLKDAREHYDVPKRVQLVIRAVFDGQIALSDLLSH